MLVSVPSPKPAPGSLRFEPPRGIAASNAQLPHLHQAEAPLPQGLRGSVMMLGNFDGLHRGHRALLAAAHARSRAEGRPLAVMACEPHPKRFFAPDLPPFRLSCGTARYGALAEAGLGLIWSPRFDAGFAGLSPRDFIEEYLVRDCAVSAVVVGEDFRFGARRAGDVALLAREGERWGYRLEVVRDVRHEGLRISSSEVRKAIAAGDLARARVLLGGAWRVPVSCKGLGVYGVAAEQMLPPEGRYPVLASCRRASPLARLTIEVTQNRSLIGQLPDGTASLSF